MIFSATKHFTKVPRREIHNVCFHAMPDLNMVLTIKYLWLLSPLWLLAKLANAQDCSLCYDGSSPPRPNLTLRSRTVTQFGSNTCGELATNPTFLASDPTTCAELQLAVGMGECDCLPKEGFCSICPDRSIFTNPDTFVEFQPNDDGFTTCRVLAAKASETEQTDANSCTQYHLSAHECGCPPAQLANPCSLCSDGSSPPLANSVANQELGLTCSQVEPALNYISASSAVCKMFQIDGTYNCGCPVPDLCGFCPGGLAFPQPDLTMADGTVCKDIPYTVALSTEDEDDCSFGYLSYAAECQCPSVDNPCTLCEDGSVPRPNMEVDGVTCRDIDANLQVAPVGSDVCDLHRSIYGPPCRCPTAPEVCEVCPLGGSVPRPNLPVDVQGESTTCGQLETSAALITADDSSCRDVQSYAAECECSCSLCPDGTSSPPDPSRTTSSGETCGALEAEAASAAGNCTKYELAGAQCGCPALDSGSCSMCAGGEAYEEPAAPKATSSIVAVDCTARETLLKSVHGSTDTCAYYQFLNFNDCGCTSLPPARRNSDCTLCQEGARPENFDLVPPGQELTCGQLYSSATYLTEDECPDIAKYAAVCACPGEDEFILTCTLCEDESDLRNPTLQISPDQACAQVETAALEPGADGLTDQDKCIAYRATYGIYCGCNNAKASEDSCRLCGGVQLLPDPSRLAGEGTSCADIEFSAHDGDCAALQLQYGDTCCRVDPTPPPTMMPSARDVLEPTVTWPPTGSSAATVSVSIAGSMVLLLIVAMV